MKFEKVSESKNFKINQINSRIDKKSKQVLNVVSDILSRKLAKVLVDEIIEDIVLELNRNRGNMKFEKVSESKNFKINQINSRMDKKSKQVLNVVSDILSRKLAKVLVDEIIEDIVSELN